MNWNLWQTAVCKLQKEWCEISITGVCIPNVANFSLIYVTLEIPGGKHISDSLRFLACHNVLIANDGLLEISDFGSSRLPNFYCERSIARYSYKVDVTRGYTGFWLLRKVRCVSFNLCFDPFHVYIFTALVIIKPTEYKYENNEILAHLYTCSL